jgi:hypothetical protein
VTSGNFSVPESEEIEEYYFNEMAIVLTSEKWFLLSGTENTDGGLIINLNKQVSINPRKLVPFTSSNSFHMFYPLLVESG